jgi:hypothetical protein
MKRWEIVLSHVEIYWQAIMKMSGMYGVLVVQYCLLDIDVFGYAVFQCQHYYGDMEHMCALANFVLVGVSTISS